MATESADCKGFSEIQQNVGNIDKMNPKLTSGSP